MHYLIQIVGVLLGLATGFGAAVPFREPRTQPRGGARSQSRKGPRP